ncbi:MAG: MFS transporter [Microbacteriaceae bacterium]|nr:MFS transporter [Microbacteriaceae bacterium]
MTKTRKRLLIFLAITIAAVNMRSVVTAVAPVYEQIDADIHLGTLEIGLLGAVPAICFGLFALLTPLFWRWLSLEVLLFISMLLIVTGSTLRAISGAYVWLFLSSFIALAAIGVANAAMPPIVKKYFPDKIGAMTAIYVSLMNIVSFLPPLLTPFVVQIGGWRLQLGMWAVPAIAAATLWFIKIVSSQRDLELTGEIEIPEAADARKKFTYKRILKTRLAWAMILLFGVPSAFFYVIAAWLPQLLEYFSGIPMSESSFYLFLLMLTGVPGSLVLPVLTVKMRSVWPIIIGAFVLHWVGYAGLVFMGHTVPWLWVLLIGLAPSIFPMTMTLINLRTKTRAGALALSSATQGFGYAIPMISSVVVGVLFDLTGTWNALVWFMLIISFGMLASGLYVTKQRYLEDEVEF